MASTPWRFAAHSRWNSGASQGCAGRSVGGGTTTLGSRFTMGQTGTDGVGGGAAGGAAVSGAAACGAALVSGAVASSGLSSLIETSSSGVSSLMGSVRASRRAGATKVSFNIESRNSLLRKEDLASRR